MPHNTSISEFERQKQDKIAIVKDLIRQSFDDGELLDVNMSGIRLREKSLSKLVKNILVEIDKV